MTWPEKKFQSEEFFFTLIPEGVIPIEMSLCINDLVSRKLISLESLNQAIK